MYIWEEVCLVRGDSSSSLQCRRLTGRSLTFNFPLSQKTLFFSPHWILRIHASSNTSFHIKSSRLLSSSQNSKQRTASSKSSVVSLLSDGKPSVCGWRGMQNWKKKKKNWLTWQTQKTDQSLLRSLPGWIGSLYDDTRGLGSGQFFHFCSWMIKLTSGFRYLWKFKCQHHLGLKSLSHHFWCNTLFSLANNFSYPAESSLNT